MHVLEEDGPEKLAEVAGIFGFAFWDSRKAQLTLARDPLGVKQLYYHDDGRRLVFASEIKSLLQCPDVPRHPDPEAINQYLHFHTALFERTFFRDIRQLRAGEYLQFTRYGRHSRIYWSVEDFSPLEGSPNQLIEKLREELSFTVGEQLMSDVPVGSFFSGGIDSSSIAAYANRHGKRPICFGVHFSNQGVADERPYQEAAAKALGLELQLITLDGSSFRDDLLRLLYHQDEPVIGAAMFPMAAVSQLAARQVKVCLGGQGADELFGGYARYALARPGQVISSWFTGRASKLGEVSNVSGNLGKQLTEIATIRRLARNARRIFDWEASYFDNFAKVPERTWAEVFGSPEFYDRERCRQRFHEHLLSCPATDPADKIMHWDMRTYLTGLFHQDDRMSMAASLESRVPIADPRLVRFAFRVKFDAKFRGGASKWILRQAVSDVLPQSVINRRKVGFDTPTQAWMTGPHFDFVRDLMLSKKSRERGFWNINGIEQRLSQTNTSNWFDVFWKVVCIEAWASVFLDRQNDAKTEDQAYVIAKRDDPAARPSAAGTKSGASIRDLAQEVQELGLRRTFARAAWEVKTKTGLVKWKERYAARQVRPVDLPALQLISPDTDPASVAGAMRRQVPVESLSRLASVASEATRGGILSFSHATADFGDPVDWHLNPRNGARWHADLHWTEVLRNEAQVGDVKLTWEAARFPQAFYLARAAAFQPVASADLATALFSQIESFLASSKPGHGVHWNSSQEIVLRLMAWSFGLQVFGRLGFPIPKPELESKIRQYLCDCAVHLGSHIDHAQDSVYNNHLVSEALGLYYFAGAHPDRETGVNLRSKGLRLLEEQANVQFYPDGSYIMNSHNYHRSVVQMYLWAVSCNRASGTECPLSWYRAVERSLDFLLAHQNPTDGSLPNFGANDGSLPLPLTTCDFADFRPTLQAASIVTRQEKVYGPGPWDEMSAWLFGPEVLALPLRQPERRSISFSGGYHVLRGQDERSFATFRCGTLLDRYSQIDMLQLDIYWKGHNVLVDAGSYLYNGPQDWHEYFCRTASHNTVQVDGYDQMVHLRRFKNVYNTRAPLLRFEDRPDWTLCEGEHYGFKRRSGSCVHRRSVLFVKDDMWIVVDRVLGQGNHNVRLHWLAGEFPFLVDEEYSLELNTPDGLFTVSSFDETARPLPASAVAGASDPPRGWMSRHYAHKVPVPSFAVERKGELPLAVVSVLCQGKPRVQVSGGMWSVFTESSSVEFALGEGELTSCSIRVSSSVTGCQR